MKWVSELSYHGYINAEKITSIMIADADKSFHVLAFVESESYILYAAPFDTPEERTEAFTACKLWLDELMETLNDANCKYVTWT